MAVTEPAIIAAIRTFLVMPEREHEFGLTVVLPAGATWRGMGIRPELLSENQNGDRIYRMNRRQAKKLFLLYKQGASVGGVGQ